MDAVKFIQEFDRMNGDIFQSLFNGMPVEKAVKVVEEWSAAHPRKTRQSVFLEQWPDADKDKSGVCSICPKYVNRGVRCARDGATFKRCEACRREFWMQEVE